MTLTVKSVFLICKPSRRSRCLCYATCWRTSGLCSLSWNYRSAGSFDLAWFGCKNYMINKFVLIQKYDEFFAKTISLSVYISDDNLPLFPWALKERSFKRPLRGTWLYTDVSLEPAKNIWRPRSWSLQSVPERLWRILKFNPPDNERNTRCPKHIRSHR